ncbi:hypothetical protein DFH28DRAFT_932199 [Melampsora americana]|nr:hypothetical protein DFH28DRAFT_932199 [Melampsora americana]
MKKRKITDLPIELLKLCFNELNLQELITLSSQSQNHLISNVTLELLRSRFLEFLIEIKSCFYKLILEISFPSDYKKTYKTSLNLIEFKPTNSPKKTLCGRFNSEIEVSNRSSKVPNYLSFDELFKEQIKNQKSVTVLINLSLYNLNSRHTNMRYEPEPVLCGRNWRGARHEISIFEYLVQLDLDHLPRLNSESTNHSNPIHLPNQIFSLGSLHENGLQIHLEFSNSHFKFKDLNLDCLQLFDKLKK